MELQGLLQHILDEKNEPKELCHVVIPSLGEFKGRCSERWHLLLLSDVMELGFKPQLLVERVAAMLRGGGKRHGPVTCDEDSNLLSTVQVEDEFHTQLIQNYMVCLGHPNEALSPVPQTRVSQRNSATCKIDGSLLRQNRVVRQDP
eukprot:5069243-Ditylum_brightwellii.AAC.1